MTFKLPQPHQLLAASALAVAVAGSPTALADASKLREKYAAMSAQLRRNDFGRPLTLASAETPREIRGEIYAEFAHPFEQVKAALDQPSEWCDVLLLPFNSKSCQASAGSGASLTLSIGKMNDSRPDNAQSIVLDFQPLTATSQHFAVQLQADSGPVGTSNYRILVEAIPVDSKRTFLHFTYAYSYGVAAKLSMQAYLGTFGRDKIGFTVVGKGTSGEPQYVDGMRGVIERNVMRYYLAIEASLHAAGFPPQRRLEQRLNYWFTATEAYPRQLREMSRSQYLALKMGEHRGQQAEL